MTEDASSRPVRAGAADAVITPPCGCGMQGYEMRRAEGIADPLLVSAIAAGGDTIDWLLLSVDCIGLDRDFTARVRARVAAALGIAPAAITIACSHTHSGPATLPKLGDVEADEAYLSFLEEALERAALAAAADPHDVDWRFGVASLAENVNRRVRREGRVELGVDPDGPVDSRLRILRIDRRADGSPLALIVHYACHATASGGVPKISADWPGAMRAGLRAIAPGSRPPVVGFIQGCAGDVTHRIARDPHAWPEHFGQHTDVQSSVLGRLVAEAALAASACSVPIDAATIAVGTQPLTLRYHRRIAGETTELQVVRIARSGDRHDRADSALWILALPGEPFAAYSTELGEQFRRDVGAGEHRVLVCGYSNDAVGYLPTPQALSEGGYEVARAHLMYQRPAPFAASTARRVFTEAAVASARLTRA